MAYCSVIVNAPDSKQEGEAVQVTVEVTNLDTIGGWFFETGIWMDSVRLRYWNEQILPGATKTYSAEFTMPAYDVSILGWVERVTSLDPYEKVFCGADAKTVAYTPPVPPPEFGDFSVVDYSKK